MSLSAANADRFYREVAAKGEVWAIRDDEGFPAPPSRSGVRAMPFWSSRSRALAVIRDCPSYASCTPFRLELDHFVRDWLSGLEKDGLLVGLNWSGPRLVGYDIEPERVADAIAYRLQHPS